MTKYINDVGLPLVQVLMETNEFDTVLAAYTYGNDLISMNRAGENSYYHYDGLGSTRQLTDDTQAVVAEYTYDAFGNVIASTGATENTYGFTGEQFNSSSGLIYLRNRYYNPSIGRFISRDPLGTWVPMNNLYSYCHNNPINYTDPTGLLGTPGWASAVGNCIQAIVNAYNASTTGGGPQDHCTQSCNLAKNCGNSIAYILGLLHEAADYWWYQIFGGGMTEEYSEDIISDFMSNAEGMGYANDSRGCACACGGECEPCPQ